VQRLIAGPGVTICDQCIGICNEILAGKQRSPDPPCGK
jgi:ATP-dependent protease Clp ATPase subunit